MTDRAQKMNRRQRQKFVGTALGLALLVVASGATARTQSQSFETALSKDRPLLDLDLRSYGYKPRSAGRLDFLSLGFADADHVLFGWTTVDRSNGDKKIGPLTPAPSHLHALIFDIRSGQKENNHDWPTATFLATISSVDENKFLICTGDAIELLSRNFDLFREQALSRFGPCNADNLSPSRRSFSIDTGRGRQFQRSVLNADTFHPIATWSSEAANVHFTDTLLAGNCKPDFEPCIREFTGRWHPLERPIVDPHQSDSRYQNLGFADDSTVVFGTGSGIMGVTPQGSLEFRIDLQKTHYVGAIATSVRGERFAFLDIKMHGSEALDMQFPSDENVVVYSLRQKTTIYARKVKGVMWSWLPLVDRRCQFALSPDGNLLAIVDDGTLAVYQLPVPKS